MDVFKALALLVMFMLTPYTVFLMIQPIKASSYHDYPKGPNLDKLRAFLESQFVPEAGLLRAGYKQGYEDDAIYVASDNLLAFAALKSLGSSLADKVKESLQMFSSNCAFTGLHEVLMGIRMREPIRGAFNMFVGNIYSHRFQKVFRILCEVRNGSIIEDWSNYADLVAYKSIDALIAGNVSYAEELFKALMSMWSGWGFSDKVYNKTGFYDTYKIGLAIYVYRALKYFGIEWISNYSNEIDRMVHILSLLQNPVIGGIATRYRVIDEQIIVDLEDVNTETTAIIVLGLYSEYPSHIARISSAYRGRIVAVYYYPWYGEYKDGVKWCCNDCLQEELVRPSSTPVIGYYSSLNRSVVCWQLALMWGAGIDTIFVSWRGPQSYEDNVIKNVLVDCAKIYGLRIAIMIEPHPGVHRELYNTSFWNKNLWYILWNYILEHPGTYLYLNGKPLVLALNPIDKNRCTEAVCNFLELRTVGNNVDADRHQDWDLYPDYVASLTSSEPVELRIRRDGYVAIAPKLGNDVQCDVDAKIGCEDRVVDLDYILNVYELQWSWVIEHAKNVSIVAIYSWNGYHVGSVIEPHYSATATSSYDPYLLYTVTAAYINLFKSNVSGGEIRIRFPYISKEKTVTVITTKYITVTMTTSITYMPSATKEVEISKHVDLLILVIFMITIVAVLLTKTRRKQHLNNPQINHEI